MTPFQRPVQTVRVPSRKQGRIPEAMHLRAYEVYSEVYAPQEALIEGSCRGGFAVSELLAFLYAYPFPKEEWRQRVDEAFGGIEHV